MEEKAIRKKTGRPPLGEGETTRPFSVRLTERQYQAVTEWGGAEWFRSLVNARLAAEAVCK
jgi:hypothetical protein